MNEFSILIPTYNEKDNILDLIEEIHETLANYEYEIIVIDDNSPDKTAEIVKVYAANKTERIICIERTWQKGLSSAVIEGMAVANAPLIVVMTTMRGAFATAIPSITAEERPFCHVLSIQIILSVLLAAYTFTISAVLSGLLSSMTIISYS